MMSKYIEPPLNDENAVMCSVWPTRGEDLVEAQKDLLAPCVEFEVEILGDGRAFGVLDADPERVVVGAGRDFYRVDTHLVGAEGVVADGEGRLARGRAVGIGGDEVDDVLDAEDEVAPLSGIAVDLDGLLRDGQRVRFIDELFGGCRAS